MTVTPATAEAAAVLQANVIAELELAEADLRLERHETAAILATNARMPLEHVHGILAGTFYPCPRTLGRIARALGKTTDELLSEAL